MSEPKYRRVLLKLSGEALAGDAGRGFDFSIIGSVCDAIRKCVDMGVQVAIVVGGGNIWRGAKNEAPSMQRSRADHMGMLATVINSLALQDALEQRGVTAAVQTAVEMRRFAEPFVRDEAVKHLEQGHVVIFGCGTGNPYFSTDTGAALRAAEIGADALLMAKNVDGVYDSDPARNPDAKKYDEITYTEVLRQGLKALDTAATALCMDNRILTQVFALRDPENICRVVLGEKIGTIIKEDI